MKSTTRKVKPTIAGGVSSERKQPYTVQEQNDILFRVLFDLSPDAVVLIDPHDPNVSWPIIDCNEAACQMNGYRREELIGHSIDTINATPGTRAERTAYLKQLRKAGNLKIEVEHRHKSGVMFPVEVSTTLITIGKRELVVGIDRDISEHKRAEEALQKAHAELELRVQERTEELAIANQALKTDIAERKKVEEAVELSEKRFRALIENSADAITLLDADGIAIYDSPAAPGMLGYGPDEWIGKNVFELVHADDLQKTQDLFQYLVKTPGARVNSVFRLRHKNGLWYWIEAISANLLTDPSVKAIVVNYRDITERKRAEEALREHTSELASVYRASAPLLSIGTNLIAVAEEIAQIVASEFNLADCGVLLVDNVSMELNSIKRAGTFVLQPLTPSVLLDSPGLTVAAVRTGQTIYVADVSADPRYIRGVAETQSELVVPLKVGADVLGVLDLQSPHKNAFDEHTQRLVAAFAERAALALKNAQLYEAVSAELAERHRAEEELQRRLADFEAVNRLSTAMREVQTLDELLPIVLEVTLGVLRAPAGSLWLYDKAGDELRVEVTRGYGEYEKISPLLPEKSGEGIVGNVFVTRQPFVENDFHVSPRLSEAARQQVPPGWGGAGIPIRAADHVIGVLVANVPHPRELTPNEINLLTTLGEIGGNAIQRIMLGQQTERRLQHLAALSEIDRLIMSSFDLRTTLGVLLNHVIVQLNVDAADILLFDSNSLILETIAERGFRGKSIRRTQPRLDKGYAGQAILDGRMVKIENIRGQQDDEFLTILAAREAFVSYYAVPLMAKGSTKGVMEIFARAPLNLSTYPAFSDNATGSTTALPGLSKDTETGKITLDTEWMDFLNTLAGQATIAIDNATLFDELQRSNAELRVAYDATIEGWSHALDLRDRETEGHTQRVTEMTVKLARAFGLNSAELAQVRWGALLHDIGKMGVPDTILHKPGPLTDEEWLVMRKHPIFAYEMLSPIQYLSLALDIPYCHHEKWDGTGYPRGLKGEQIPFTARIFAVVDVWDALTSDRPYRVAWSAEKVIDHLRLLAGSHFDPEVLKVCIESGVLMDLKRR